VAGEASTLMRVRLVGDDLMVEEFKLPLGLAAGCVFSVAQRWRQRRGLRRLLWSLLPGNGGLVSCRVRCSHVLFVCEGVRFSA
jgi:hypothetical protein